MENVTGVVVVGDPHVDLVYTNTLFTDIQRQIALDFAKSHGEESPEELEGEISRIIAGLPKKILGNLRRIPGGNGFNSASTTARLGMDTWLISLIGEDAPDLIHACDSQQINPSYVRKVPHPTPISTIIEDPLHTKILIAQNWKHALDLATYPIKAIPNLDQAIIFFTPIEPSCETIYRATHNKAKLTAITIEAQKVTRLSDLSFLRDQPVDLLFGNASDLAQIIQITPQNPLSIEACDIVKIDREVQQLAVIRVYTAGHHGVWVLSSDFEPLFIPIFSVSVKNRTGAGDTFAAAFIACMYRQLCASESTVENYTWKAKSQLALCARYASAASALRIRDGFVPLHDEIIAFLTSQN